MKPDIIEPGTKVKVTNHGDLWFDRGSRNYIMAEFCVVVKQSKSGMYHVRLPDDQDHRTYSVPKRNLIIVDHFSQQQLTPHIQPIIIQSIATNLFSTTKESSNYVQRNSTIQNWSKS